jgi:tyrosine-protein kinase Etk/Wzc
MKTQTLIPEDDQPLALSSGHAAAGVAASGGDEISLLDLLIVLAERKWLILGITTTFMFLAVVLALVLPVRYTARVTLLPPQQNSSMAGMLSSQLGNIGGIASLAGGSLGLKNPNDMYVGMLKSETVEDAVIHRFGLMQEYKSKYLSDARKTFEGFATIDGNGKDGLIHISVEDRDPRRSAELANGYVEQFRSLSQNLAITEASQRRLFFEHEFATAKDNLADAEEALKKTEQTTGLIALDSQARALIESAAAVRALITEKEVQIQGMQSYATGQNSQMVEAERELAGLRAQLAKLGGSEGETGELMVPKGRVPQASLEYVRKLRDVKYYETIYDLIAKQLEIAKLDEAKEGQIIQVVDPATVPERKSFPKRAIIVLVATVIGFFLSVFFILAKAALRHLENSPEVAEKLIYLRRLLRLRRQTA